uniref:Lipocalin n=1 Tax=Rhipicephalus zambeziensis TaxID=60191 RepID=A0A224YCI8_9ACAR
MLIVVLLSTIVFSNAAENTFPDRHKFGHGGRMDGWLFFKRHMKYYMLKRTYIVPGGSQNAMCVQAPFSPIVYTNEYKMEKTFTYRNMSSIHKVDPNNNLSAPHWPVAKFLMQFYVSKDKRKYTYLISNQGYNYVNSTNLTTAYGYSLPAPDWRFMYISRHCVVMSVSSLTFLLPATR